MAKILCDTYHDCIDTLTIYGYNALDHTINCAVYCRNYMRHNSFYAKYKKTGIPIDNLNNLYNYLDPIMSKIPVKYTI